MLVRGEVESSVSRAVLCPGPEPGPWRSRPRVVSVDTEEWRDSESQVSLSALTRSEVTDESQTSSFGLSRERQRRQDCKWLGVQLQSLPGTQARRDRVHSVHPRLRRKTRRGPTDTKVYRHYLGPLYYTSSDQGPLVSDFCDLLPPTTSDVRRTEVSVSTFFSLDFDW